MQAAVSAKDALSRSVTDVVAVRGTVAVFVVLTLLLIVVIITYLIWRMNRSKMSVVKVLSDPKKLNGNTISPFPASSLPSLKTGQPYSVSFWIYLTDFQPTSNGKLVLWRNSPGSTLSGGAVQFTNANPLVFLDPSVNSLYVSIKTTRPIPSSVTTTDLSSLISKGSDIGIKNKWTYLTGKVDYVPLQRWVNYTFTVQNNLLSVYQDGSLYTVSDLFDMIDMTCTPSLGNACVARPLFAGVTGDMTIGNPTTCATPSGTNNSTCISDVNGFVSRVQFFNYALTSKQAREVYNAGPGSGSVLRLLGLPEYGVRSPIYQIDSTTGKSITSDLDSYTVNN
jgi:hypothetical protein